MELPVYRKLYLKMEQADAAARKQLYLETCSKLTNLQRAEMVTEMFSAPERRELSDFLRENHRWVQVAAVQIYSDELDKLQSEAHGKMPTIP